MLYVVEQVLMIQLKSNLVIFLKTWLSPSNFTYEFMVFYESWSDKTGIDQ